MMLFFFSRSAIDGTGSETDSDQSGQRGRWLQAARPAADTEAQLGRQRDVGLPFAAAVRSLHGRRRAKVNSWHGRNGTVVYYYELMARRNARIGGGLGTQAARNKQASCDRLLP